MKKILVKNQVEGGQVAFELIKESLAAGAQTLGLATGSSPIALYQEIVESDVDFSELYRLVTCKWTKYTLVISLFHHSKL